MLQTVNMIEMETIAKTIEDAFNEFLGKGGEDLLFWQAMLRSLLIYVLALTIIRISKKDS
jgi:hypothetical protein